MKKHLLFLFTALTLLLVPAALKADIVTIGDESSTSSHWAVPVNMFYGYSLTQQIYTADEINMPNGGTITSISFEYTSAASFDMSGVQVYMMNVSKDYFESNTDIVEVGPEYKVYEGTLYASGAGWVTLNLTLHYATSSEFTIETSDSCYTWNGQTYCASGNYVQTLQTVNGCDSVVTLHLTTSVGVTDHEVEVVFLAPNPTKNICRIMGLETDPISVDLYDMRGKLVMKASGRELDVTMLPTGLYMVKIYTGDRFINLKLVKQ